MIFDMLFLVPLMLIAVFAGIARKHYLNTLILIWLFLASAYVSFRADVLLAVYLAGFFPLVMKEELKERRWFLLFAGAALLNLLVLPLVYSWITDWCSWGSANHICVSPMGYIQSHTPSGSNVAADPELGHLEAYYGARPVLADLYVEYADWRKYDAEARFFYELNESALRPYNVTVMALDDKWGVKRDLNDSDRVYDNGYVHVFRKPA